MSDEYRFATPGDEQVPAAHWESTDGSVYGGVVHIQGTCTVCDRRREDSALFQVLDAAPQHSAQLDTAPGIREDLRDAGPLGVEIEEFRSQSAREFYAQRDALRKNAPEEVGVSVLDAQAAASTPRVWVQMPAEEQAKIDALDAPNPKQRFGDLKVALQLVPPALAIHAAKALKEGADKYGAYNWRTQPVEAMTYIGGLLRHAAAYLDGEDIDPESSTGKTHLDGMAANIAILLDALDLGTLIDNRPPKGPAPKLVRTPK